VLPDMSCLQDELRAKREEERAAKKNKKTGKKSAAPAGGQLDKKVDFVCRHRMLLQKSAVSQFPTLLNHRPSRR